MAMLTLRLPRRTTLTLALAVFAVGHVVVAVGSQFALLLAPGSSPPWPPGRSGRSRPSSPAAPRDREQHRAPSASSGRRLPATVIGVPLGALAGQLIGWRGTFWALALLAVAAVPLIARHVTDDSDDVPA